MSEEPDQIYQLSKNEIYGRYLIAKEAINPLTPILSEFPIVVGPLVNSYPTCLGCHHQIRPKKPTKKSSEIFDTCSKCNWPICNPICEHDPNHQQECEFLQKHKVSETDFLNGQHRITTYASILPLRMEILKQTDSMKFKKIMELESHIVERYNSEMFRQVYCRETVPYLQSIVEGLDEDDILEMMGVLDTNTFQIKFDKVAQVHVRGLYCQAAMMAHDCKPNCFYVIDPKSLKLQVYSSAHVQKGMNYETQIFRTSSLNRSKLE